MAETGAAAAALTVLDDIHCSRSFDLNSPVSFAITQTNNMRPATRLLAQASRYLEAGNPTGLTGLVTHASPRSTLMYTYNTMLEKLKKFPESSVYRQSVEALTKQRLSVIESIKPEGLDEWQQRVTETVKTHPEAFRIVGNQTNAKEVNFIWKESAIQGVQSEEFDDEPPSKPELEGPRTIKEKSAQANTFQRDLRLENAKFPRIEPEPPLSAEQ